MTEEIDRLVDALIGMVALEDFLKGLDLEREYWMRVGGYTAMALNLKGDIEDWCIALNPRRYGKRQITHLLTSLIGAQ